MPQGSLIPRVAVLVISGVLLLSNASAQVITGVVTERASAEPLRGAFVAVFRADGQRIGGVLTGANGEFVVRASPGRYSLRVDMIGHQSVTIPAFELSAGQTLTMPVRLEIAAMRLAELSVRGDRRCSARPEANAETAAVWEEAKKALQVNAWVQGGGAVFRTRVYERWLDRSLKQVGVSEMKFSTGAGRQAFRAISTEDLSRFGFARPTPDGGMALYGPDAEVLLSETFLDQHCFWLERSADRRSIGLAFEPVRGRRLPEIAGTLWLDQATGALRHIEYRYVNVANYDDARFAGGRVEFERLRNGAWIVRRWYIRAPQLQQSSPSAAPTVVGAHEDGGEVLDVTLPSDPVTVTLTARAPLRGFVHDSIRGRPLEGAVVYLSGTHFRTTATIAGAFQFDSIPVGEYYLAFMHPVLDSLPVLPGPMRVNVDAGVVNTVMLGTQSAESVLASACPDQMQRESARLSDDHDVNNRGALFGTVRSEFDISGAQVRLRWTRISGGDVRTLRSTPHGVVTEIARGNYLFCGVPLDRPLLLSVMLGTRELARDSLPGLPPHGLQRRDLTVRR